VPEPHAIELDPTLGGVQLRRIRRVGNRDWEVEDLEHPLERHHRGEHFDARVRELGERLVQLIDVEHERGDGAGRDRARDREVAADPVDDRAADRGDEPEGHEQHAAVHGGAHADVTNAAGALVELFALASR